MSDDILNVEGIVTQQVGSLIWLGQIERSAVAAIMTWCGWKFSHARMLLLLCDVKLFVDLSLALILVFCLIAIFIRIALSFRLYGMLLFDCCLTIGLLVYPMM